MKKLLLAIMAVSCFAVISCKEEEEAPIPQVKGTVWTVTYLSSGDFDITFKSNGDIIYEEGLTLEDPAGTWTQVADSVVWDFTTYASGTFIYHGKLVTADSMSGVIKVKSTGVSPGGFTAVKI